MSGIGIAVAIVSFLVLVPVGLLLAMRHDRELADWALENDAKFEGKDPSLATRWSGAPFKRSGRAIDVLSGRTRQSNPFTAFVYQYSSGEDVTNIAITVIRLPGSVPELTLTVEGFGAKVAKVFGGQDIELGDHEFDRRYRIRASDEQFARRLLTQPVMTWLISHGSGLIPLRFVGADLICWTPGRTVTATLRHRLDTLDQFVALLSPEIWRQPPFDPPLSFPPADDVQPTWPQPPSDWQ